MWNNKSIAVVLPTYNEHLSIAECINRFEALGDAQTAEKAGAAARAHAQRWTPTDLAKATRNWLLSQSIPGEGQRA